MRMSREEHRLLKVVARKRTEAIAKLRLEVDDLETDLDANAVKQQALYETMRYAYAIVLLCGIEIMLCVWFVYCCALLSHSVHSAVTYQ
jgi:hypothetical protein